MILKRLIAYAHGNKGLRSITTMIAAMSVLVGLAAPGGAYPRPANTEMLSVSPDGQPGDNDSAAMAGLGGGAFPIAATGDGRFVAFVSIANNLVGNDGNVLTRDIFVRDRKKDETEIVTLGLGGTPALSLTGRGLVPQGSEKPAISSNGRYVAFVSDAINLVPGDTNNVTDVFVFDRKRSTSQRVSIDSKGAEANDISGGPGSHVAAPAIDASGRFVAFQSVASNLVKDDTNSACEQDDLPRELGLCPGEGWDTFVHDRSTHMTERVSLTPSGEQQNGDSIGPASISADGRYVLFASDATNIADLGPIPCSEQLGLNYRCAQVYVHDRKARSERTRLISKSSTGTPAAAKSHVNTQALSADGRFALFSTSASNLVPTSGPYGGFGMYVSDLKTNRIERVTVTSTGEDLAFGCDSGSISGDGRSIAMACGHGPSRLQGSSLLVHDRHTGYLDVRAIDDGYTRAAVASRTGRFIFYASDEGAPLLDGLAPLWQVYARDRGETVSAQLGTPDPRDSSCSEIDCLGPDGFAARSDPLSDSMFSGIERGAELTAVEVAYRPDLGDLFVKIEVDDFPTVTRHGLLYGTRFQTEDGTFELRVLGSRSRPGGGRFGLFSCDGSVCTEQARLKGGYGTTGARVVVAIPLHTLEIGEPNELIEIEAFSALGNYATGAMRVLDTVRI